MVAPQKICHSEPSTVIRSGWRSAVEEPAVGRAENCPLADKPCCARNDIGVRRHNIVQSSSLPGLRPAVPLESPAFEIASSVAPLENLDRFPYNLAA